MLKSLIPFLYLVFISSSLAAPSITIDTEFYTISGTNLKSIHQSLQQLGPVGKNGRRFHARTLWQLNWSYRWIASTKQCRLTRTSVDTEIRYLMPKLSDPSLLDEDDLGRWQSYYDALFRHEQQHKDFGVQAATELDRRLKTIPARPCDDLENAVKAVADEVLDKYQRLEQQFDVDTDHGRKQGVILTIRQ